MIILGSNGQLARAIFALAPASNPAVILGRPVYDLEKVDELALAIDHLLKVKPVPVINCAAYTQVDLAETEITKANLINHVAVAAIAKVCQKNSAPLIHFSSDYVYGRNDDQPIFETDRPQPQGIYAKTKLTGDEAILDSGCAGFIIRTSWVYDHLGKNFFNTMVRLMNEKKEIRIVDDQIGNPTYAPDLAVATLQLIEKIDPSRPATVIHATNHCDARDGSGISWFQFAEMIRAKAGSQTRLIPIPSTDYPTPAIRPKNSRLSLRKLNEEYQILTPTVSDGLSRCFDLRIRSS